MPPRSSVRVHWAVLVALCAGCGSSLQVDPEIGPRPEARQAAPQSNGGTGGGCGPFTPAWWDATYQARRPLTLTYGGTLAAGYSVGLVWDSTGDVTAGRMLASGDDVRVVHFDGATNTELHRHLLAMNTAKTEVWFKTQAAITTSTAAYWLYFKDSAPAAPLAAWSDAMAGTSPVYLAADSFESYTLGSALPSVSSWVGSSNYTVRADPKDAANQTARVVGTGGKGAYLFAGSYAWTDVAMRVRYLDQSPTAMFMGFMLRAENASPFHFLYTGYSNPATQLQFWNCSLNAPTDTALASNTQFPGAAWATASNDGTNWHDHVIRVKGTRVRHSIDGVEWFPAAYPTNAFNANTVPAAGRIGLLEGYQNGTAYYDDVIVRAFVEPEPAVAAGADEAGCDPCAFVTCTALDQCHDAGVCNPSTGLCSNPAKADGTGCDDANACTQTDTCQAGACAGANPVACAALDSCHDIGTCNAGTGVCSNPAKADGAACNDGDACTQTDTCQSGACAGANPVVCSALDICHDVGTCNAGTGLCSNPVKADGSACNDGNACTQTDTCQAGACTGANPVVCSALDACHTAGTCSPGTGACTNPAKADGSNCDDGSACTQTDSCQAGTCTGANPVICAALDACHDVGTCNAATGVCSTPVKPDGSACDDGNACTQTDTCQSGTCTGANPVVCAASDSCHAVGTCDSATGVCGNPAKADGAACDDGNACTRADACQAGTCTGGDPIDCGVEGCRAAGTCDPATGSCSGPPRPDGTACDDADACTRTSACQSGTCLGADPVLCVAKDACHEAGTCDRATGACSDPAKADGTPCDDADSCSTGDRCVAGTCTGVPTVTCAPVECQVAGCDPASGCLYSPVPDGEACNGGLGECKSGSCGPPKPISFDIGCGCGAAGDAGALPLFALALGLAGALRRRPVSRA